MQAVSWCTFSALSCVLVHRLFPHSLLPCPFVQPGHWAGLCVYTCVCARLLQEAHVCSLGCVLCVWLHSVTESMLPVSCASAFQVVCPRFPVPG